MRMRVLDSPTAGTEMVGMEGEGVGVEDVEVVAGEKRTVGVRVKGEGEGLLGGYLGLEFGEMGMYVWSGGGGGVSDFLCSPRFSPFFFLFIIGKNTKKVQINIPHFFFFFAPSSPSR